MIDFGFVNAKPWAANPLVPGFGSEAVVHKTASRRPVRQTTMRIQLQRSAGFTMIEIMIVVIIIGLLAAVGVPNFLRSRVKAQRESCIKALGTIDGAKQQWAIENKKLKGYPVVISDITPYLSNKIMPICPASGTYTIGAVGTKPTCTIADHVLE